MNVYEELGLQRIINASGRMTALGVSTVDDKICSAVALGAKSFVVIDDLIDKAGIIISRYTGAENSCVTCSASAGIAIAIAGMISKGRKSIIEQLPLSSGLANQVVIQKGHMIQYGACMSTMIALGGGIAVEVGMSNKVTVDEVEEAINDQTVCLMYVKSHHCVQKGMLSIETMLDIAHKHRLPLLVDAAAEEDLRKYISIGADLVVYSGSKAIQSTTSGFITGREELITFCKRQYGGIGRAMKIGKENIMGLLKALELYEAKNEDEEIIRQRLINAYLIKEINQMPGFSAKEIEDEAGRHIYRTEVKVDPSITNMNAVEIDKKLRSGNISIHCRKHLLEEDIMSFDPRPLGNGDKEMIIQKLIEIIGGSL